MSNRQTRRVTEAAIAAGWHNTEYFGESDPGNRDYCDDHLAEGRRRRRLEQFAEKRRLQEQTREVWE